MIVSLTDYIKSVHYHHMKSVNYDKVCINTIWKCSLRLYKKCASYIEIKQRGFMTWKQKLLKEIIFN